VQRRGVTKQANADRFAVNVLPIIQQIKASGATSLRAIAKALNARGEQVGMAMVTFCSGWTLPPRQPVPAFSLCPI
jgi:hypothetical protein